MTGFLTAIAIFAGAILFSSDASAANIAERTFLGPVVIKGINQPPNDNTYDWRAYTMKDGGIYKMWWVRGTPWDRVYYSESKDGLHYGNYKKVLEPAENKFEKWHVGHTSLIKHPNGTYYMFYESSMNDEYTNGPDNNIYLATSKDGINWQKYPSNNDPMPVINGYNREQKRYGVGLPSVHFRDGKFIIYYVDDCEGQGNKMRRAESLNGIHWGTSAAKHEPDPRNHPVMMYGNVGEVKYNKTLNRCVMAFSINGTLIGQPKDDYSHDIYLAVSLDSEGKQWAKTPPRIWDLAKPENNITATSDTDKDYRLRFFPTIICDPLGQIDGKTLQITYTKGKQADVGQDWKVHCVTWDLYRVQATLR